MDRKKILVIDDEQDLCDILVFNLEMAGFEADCAYSAEEGLKKDLPVYDLLLLDVMMPGMSGFEMAKRLKGDKRTAHMPIIFLTARDTEDDVLHGFDIGADDYVKKPFSVKEVMARVKAVVNRNQAGQQLDGCLSYEGLVVDKVRKTVTIDGVPMDFTRTEFDLLCIFLQHPGKVFSRQQLLDEVWPKDVIVTERTVDVNITRLRKKLGPYAACVVTRLGFGYTFEEQNL
jgi:DNA-binding response OmpR family regulator